MAALQRARPSWQSSLRLTTWHFWVLEALSYLGIRSMVTSSIFFEDPRSQDDILSHISWLSIWYQFCVSAFSKPDSSSARRQVYRASVYISGFSHQHYLWIHVHTGNSYAIAACMARDNDWNGWSFIHFTNDFATGFCWKVLPHMPWHYRRN